MPEQTLHQEDCKKLRQRLRRIETRYLERGGRPVETVAVETSFLENLLDDHDDLERIKKDHPDLKDKRGWSYG